MWVMLQPPVLADEQVLLLLLPPPLELMADGVSESWSFWRRRTLFISHVLVDSARSGHTKSRAQSWLAQVYGM
jgi:hypothetical protein